MSGAGELHWFALRVLSQREDMVKKLLVWRGLRAFIKTEQRIRRKTKWDRERKARAFCAAPSYVFVGLEADSPNPWALVHGCHLIRSVVTINGIPAQLDGVKLAEFLGFDDFDMPDYFKFFRTGRQEFKIGETVRIDHPSYEGFELPVMDIQNGEAIFQLVMLEHTAELRVPIEQCYKAA